MKAPRASLALLLAACAPAPRAAPAAPESAPAVAAAVAPAPAPPPPAPDESFRRGPPPPDEVKPFVPPQATRRELGNGMPVWLIEESSRYGTLAAVAIGGLVDVPHVPHVPLAPQASPASRRDPADLVHEMLSGMLRGTRRYEYSAFTDQLGQLPMPMPRGIPLNDGVEMSATFPVDHLPAAADLLAEVVFRPSFEKQAFERSREQDARAQEDDPNDATKVARRVAERALLGTHAYGAFTTAQGTRAVQRADVVALHARAFDPSRLSLVLAGQFVEKDALAALEATFGKAKFARPKGALPVLPRPTVAAGPPIVVVDKPGAGSAAVAAVYLGPATAAPDEMASRMVLFTAVSGMVGRGARLRDELRLVPWTSPTIDQGRSALLLGWYARTETDKVAPLLAEVDRIESDLAASGPTGTELESVKRWTSGVPAGWWETPERIAEQVAETLTLGLRPESIATRFDAAATTTGEAMRAAAARYLARATMRVAVVGDLAALREPLLALGWGPIEVRDASGVVVASAAAGGKGH